MPHESIDGWAATGKVDRRTVLKAGAITALASPFAGFLVGPDGLRPSAARAADPDPAVVGSWSAPFDVGGVAIHATLTHVGDVLIFGRPVRGTARSFVATWNHSTGLTMSTTIPYPRDLFCAGNNILPDGRVYVAGGHSLTESGAVGWPRVTPTTRRPGPGPVGRR